MDPQSQVELHSGNVHSVAAKAAYGLLDSTWPGGKDDPGLPIDPAQIARKLGIDVYETALRPDVFAVLVKEPGQDPKIALNISDSKNRKRFSCAHEIGHYTRRSLDTEQYAYLDKRSPLSATGLDVDEIYANSFAACLLMPETIVTFLFNRGDGALGMALRFDVSQEAMQYRLRNLGLLTGG
jgi:Zn-dependent peptidase ImmA (M78 family)